MNLTLTLTSEDSEWVNLTRFKWDKIVKVNDHFKRNWWGGTLVFTTDIMKGMFIVTGKGTRSFTALCIWNYPPAKSNKRFQVPTESILKRLPSCHYFCFSCRRFLSHVRSDAAHDEDPHTAARAWEPPRDHWPRPLGPQVRRQVQGRKGPCHLGGHSW